MFNKCEIHFNSFPWKWMCLISGHGHSAARLWPPFRHYSAKALVVLTEKQIHLQSWNRTLQNKVANSQHLAFTPIIIVAQVQFHNCPNLFRLWRLISVLWHISTTVIFFKWQIARPNVDFSLKQINCHRWN